MPEVLTGEVVGQHLETGMILLDPNDGTPQIWTVASMGHRPHLIAHYGTVMADATLRRNELPDGWHIIKGEEIAKRFRGLVAADA